MFTQCPDCATAFRVTADVLKQAGGKVRCGGCGNAFNALMYLSETRPAAPPREKPEEALPELRPDPAQKPQRVPEPEAPPQAISPEQSAALLKTLDELAGADIRLEDTGVEWRLLPDDDEIDEDAETPELDAELSADAGASHIDELLDDTPTPVDEFLTKTPNKVEAAEVFADDDDASQRIEGREIFEDAADDDELRFDDNTGLPDAFDDDGPATPPPRAPEPPEPEPAPEPREMQVDLAFGDPEEWGALLDEVATDDGDSAEEPDDAVRVDLDEAIIEPEAAERGDAGGTSLEEELAALPDCDDESGDEGPPDIDTQFGLQAVALGIGTSGAHAADEEEADQAADEMDEVDASDTSIDDDLIAAAFEAEAGGDHSSFPDSTGELEVEIAQAQALVREDSADPGDGARDQAAASDHGEKEPGEEEIDEDSFELEVLGDEDENDENDEYALGDGAFDFEPGDEDDEVGDDGRAGSEHVEEADRPVHVVPPPTEEEQTINAMIDQDLLRFAVEDPDGFSSTMVLRDGADAEPAGAKKRASKSAGKEGSKTESDAEAEQDDPYKLPIDSSGKVETIIMEGDFVRTALEEEALKEQERDRKEAEKAEKDSEHSRIIAALKSTMRGEAHPAEPPGRSRFYGIIAAVFIAFLALGGQVVHQSRAELATIPAVNSIIAPIYRAVGAPITPEWDVTGWRFEVTRGSTNASGLKAKLAAAGTGVELSNEEAATDSFDDDGVDGAPEVLTIYSRIGNQGAHALPYPLITVSLTDRFEETIGSKVLSPAEYLAGASDPSNTVQPGETFNAVISIESPAAEATGFKLNVCYRQAGGKLRCAIEDFL